MSLDPVLLHDSEADKGGSEEEKDRFVVDPANWQQQQLKYQQKYHAQHRLRFSATKTVPPDHGSSFFLFAVRRWPVIVLGFTLCVMGVYWRDALRPRWPSGANPASCPPGRVELQVSTPLLLNCSTETARVPPLGNGAAPLRRTDNL